MTTFEDAAVEAPREDLTRGLTPIRAEDDGNVMVGYPVVFDQWTEINSWEGHFMERVRPSGPVRALKANPDRIKVQYNHGMHPVVGTSGLGRPRLLRADDFGVYTETPLTQTSYNRDIIKPQLADGTLDGMSFRFSVNDDKWVRPKEPSEHNPNMLPERSIVEFRWHEFGPVDWPAYEAAQAGIRSAIAFQLWQQTPQEQRSALMQQHHIAIPSEPRVWVPGWEPKRDEDGPVTEDSSPGEATDESNTRDQAETTRALDDATKAPVTPYQPVQPPTMSPERRESQRGLVRAWAAQSQRSA